MARLAAAGRPKCRSSSLFYAHGDWPQNLRGEKVCTVCLSLSLLPRLGAVAVTVTTALDRVTVRVTGEWCGVGRRMRPGEPGFGCGLARESVGRVGFEVGL